MKRPAAVPRFVTGRCTCDLALFRSRRPAVGLFAISPRILSASSSSKRLSAGRHSTLSPNIKLLKDVVDEEVAASLRPQNQVPRPVAGRRAVDDCGSSACDHLEGGFDVL